MSVSEDEREADRVGPDAPEHAESEQHDSEPSETPDGSPDADDLSAEDRARAAIAAIANGANPSSESFTLANRFTDEQAARFAGWVRGIFGRRS